MMLGVASVAAYLYVSTAPGTDCFGGWVLPLAGAGLAGLTALALDALLLAQYIESRWAPPSSESL